MLIGSNGRDAYFSVASLKKAGFTDELDMLGFGDRFCASILREDDRFSWQRIGGMAVFNSNRSFFTTGNFLAAYVAKEGSIGLDELILQIEKSFGISIDRSRAQEKVTKDNVYYKVYDYYGIDHNSNINRAREIMVEVAYGDVGVVADGSFSKPDVRFTTVDNNEIELRLAYTVVDHEDYGVISARIREGIFKRFKEEGIDIPYPQYEVHVIPVEKDPPDT